MADSDAGDFKFWKFSPATSGVWAVGFGDCNCVVVAESDVVGDVSNGFPGIPPFVGAVDWEGNGDTAGVTDSDANDEVFGEFKGAGSCVGAV